MGLLQKSLIGIKNLFLFGVSMNPYIERLEGKIGEAPFFKVQPGKITENLNFNQLARP